MENEVLYTTENEEVVEDLDTNEGENTEEIEETGETGEEIEEETEETGEIEEETEEEPLSDEIFDELLGELSNNEEDIEEEEELITEPSFFNDNDEITEEDLEIIDQTIGELEDNISKLETEKETLAEELSLVKENEQNISDAIDKLGEHPILGPLNEKLLKGEEINIPEYLQEKIKNEKESIPNMEEVVNEPNSPQGEQSLEDILVGVQKGQLDFLRKI